MSEKGRRPARLPEGDPTKATPSVLPAPSSTHSTAAKKSKTIEVRDARRRPFVNLHPEAVLYLAPEMGPSALGVLTVLASIRERLSYIDDACVEALAIVLDVDTTAIRADLVKLIALGILDTDGRIVDSVTAE